MTVATRRRSFSSAHFYHQKSLSIEENQRIFGRCDTPHGHGHDYTLEVSVAGSPKGETEMVIDLSLLDRILFEVTDPLDHRHLNFDIPAFRDQVPTTENVALYLRSEVEKKIADRGYTDLRIEKIRLFETPEIWVELR